MLNRGDNVGNVQAELTAALKFLGEIPPMAIPRGLEALRYLAPRPGEEVSVTLHHEEDGRFRQIRRDASSQVFDREQDVAIIRYSGQPTGELAPLPLSGSGSLSSPSIAAAAAAMPAAAVRETHDYTSSITSTERDAFGERCRDIVLALHQAENDPRFREFVGIKAFRDQYLPALGYAWAYTPQARHEALAMAIEYQWVIKGSVPNPRHPDFPTTTVRVNRNHPDLADEPWATGKSGDGKSGDGAKPAPVNR